VPHHIFSNTHQLFPQKVEAFQCSHGLRCGLYIFEDDMSLPAHFLAFRSHPRRDNVEDRTKLGEQHVESAFQFSFVGLLVQVLEI
jgi:hypothetical protein